MPNILFPRFSAFFLAGVLAGAPLALADDPQPPIPLPDGSDIQAYDAAGGSLDLDSPMTVKDLAAFFRKVAKDKGWKETPSVIKNDNMAVLEFSAGGKDVATITIMKMGDHSNVTAEGDGLASKDAAAADAGNASSASASASSTDANGGSGDAPAPLVAADKDGLPIPDGLGNTMSSSTMFSKTVGFTAPNSVADIVAFYRTELGKKGWKEDSANVSDTEATLAFTAPEGPAKLTVKRNGDASDAELSLTDKAKAAASPLAAKPGMVKLLFGNLSPNAADVAIAGQHVKIAAGAGSKGPDGPSLDVKPGKFTATMKGAPAADFTAGPDEVWFVGVGPGGLIAIKQ